MRAAGKNSPNVHFKDDETFGKNLAMAYVGELAAIDLMRAHGHDFELDGYGAGSFDIFKDLQKKQKRTPDLICKRCRQRLEVRAKSKLRVAMSDSPKRRFDSELLASDWVGFLRVIVRGPRESEVLDLTRPESYLLPKVIYVISVSELSDTREAALASDRKPEGKGSETFLEWPTLVAKHTGVVEVISRSPDRISVRSSAAERLHEYTPNKQGALLVQPTA